MIFIKWVKLKLECRKTGHTFVFDSHGVIGDWIKCSRCQRIDEYIPGTHEPNGYKPTHSKTAFIGKEK